MKLREHLQINIQSIKLLDSLSRRYLLSMTAKSVVGGILPYVPVYFSARLIDALAAGEPVEALSLYVTLTVGLTALLGLLNAWLNAQYSIGWQEQSNAFDWLYAQKAMELSYASIEDREVTLLRERIKMESQTGYNIWYLVDSIQHIVENLIRVAASVSLCVSFFGVGTVPLWAKLAFVGGVILTVAASARYDRSRALYKDAAFIVLDEPTAALDPESEYEVYSKFNQISGGKTAIYISHRLASCKSSSSMRGRLSSRTLTTS